jgi:hypothetical protein
MGRRADRRQSQPEQHHASRIILIVGKVQSFHEPSLEHKQAPTSKPLGPELSQNERHIFPWLSSGGGRRLANAACTTTLKPQHE